MHIKSIEVENFGQFEHKKVTLVDGLVVIRGANESGKSTLTRVAPLYAMFGSSTLDVAVPDMIRLGAKKMSVTLEYGPYTVKRSPTSASVVGNGIQISGQEEVSSFFYNLFGLAKGSEDAVLVARQGDTQGIISKRPGEVSAFIESIAGFSQIDELLEKVKIKYPSGSKATIEELLEVANEKLIKTSVLIEEKAAAFDLGACYKEIALLTRAISNAEKTKADAEKNLNTEKELQNKNREHNHKVELYKKDFQNATEKLKELSKKLEDLNTAYAKVNLYTQEEIETSQELLDSAAKRRKDLAAKSWVDSIPEHDEWGGTIETLREEVKAAKNVVSDIDNSRAINRVNIATCERGINNKEICSECGQSVVHLHEELNRVNKEKLVALKIEKDTLDKLYEEKRTYRQSLESFLFIDLKPVEHPQISVDRNFVPCRYEWVGCDPSPISDELIAQASSLLVEAASSAKKLNEINESIVTTSKAILLSEKVLANLVSPGEFIEVSNGVVDKLNETIGWLTKEITTAKLNLTAIEKTLEEFLNDKKNLESAVEETKKTIADLNTRLLTEDRNSKIVKSVRDARPVVANTIWNTVLENTAAMFASIRGKVEEIEKTNKGFLAGGITLRGLSGSAKSIFGLTMRVVLKDMFAPSAQFIILDEVTSDADQERTAAIMGFLQAIGGQRIIITHSDQFESYADQIIELS